MYYTYVLLCKNNSGNKCFYTGYCEDLKNRYKEHVQKEIKTTKKFDKITLVYYEACINKKDAIVR